MIKRIEKGRAVGSVYAPTSKSMAHRALICAALCQGESYIEGITECEDVLATIDCLRAFGVKIEYNGRAAKVEGIDFKRAVPNGPLDCRESGSTLRFLIPLAMLSGKTVTFTGSERLMARSQSVYEKIADEKGLTFKNGGKAITVCGPITAGEYLIDGNVSSQFISGLMFALSALGEESKIKIRDKFESRPYVDLTIDSMKEFGIEVKSEGENSFSINARQDYKAGARQVEGDFSGAAFLDAFNHLGGDVRLCGLNKNSRQGDRAYTEYFPMLSSENAEIDISNCPDLGPILFALAAAKNGAIFLGTKRLRDKESDRVGCMQKELAKFGAEILADENSVRVLNRELHGPSERLCGHNDHRIVMSLSVLCTLYGGEIEGCEAVSKSYPDFFKDIKSLGIDVYDIE